MPAINNRSVTSSPLTKLLDIYSEAPVFSNANDIGNIPAKSTIVSNWWFYVQLPHYGNIRSIPSAIRYHHSRNRSYGIKSNTIITTINTMIAVQLRSFVIQRCFSGLIQRLSQHHPFVSSPCLNARCPAMPCTSNTSPLCRGTRVPNPARYTLSWRMPNTLTLNLSRNPASFTVWLIILEKASILSPLSRCHRSQVCYLPWPLLRWYDRQSFQQIISRQSDYICDISCNVKSTSPTHIVVSAMRVSG